MTDKKLTAKQEAFCQHYVNSKSKNATEAAINAGYSESTARMIGSENLTKPDIKARIVELTADTIKQTKIDANWVLTGAKQVFDRCMQIEPITDAKGNPKMVEVEGGRVAAAFKFDSSGANKALEIVGKHIDVRAFIERSENVNVEMTHEEWLASLEDDDE